MPSDIEVISRVVTPERVQRCLDRLSAASAWRAHAVNAWDLGAAMVTTRPVLSALHVAGLMAITGLVLWDGDEAGAVVRWVLGLMWVSSLLIPWLMGLLISLDLETRLREALAKHGCPPRIEKPM